MSRTLTDFHLGNSNSNMQTLDKRISASTDQLDSIRGERKIFFLRQEGGSGFSPLSIQMNEPDRTQ